VAYALIYGAGASLAAPACRPLFFAIRTALAAQLDVELTEAWADHMAPEALLSRLAGAGVDVDGELRRMLAGGRPNALHAVAAAVLARGDAVWTTNFDELIEAAASAASVDVHVLLPGDEPACQCGRGHLVKIHGTLSGRHVVARSEEVLRPLPAPWLARLKHDLRGARAAIVGYAGADIDLRGGLVEALGAADDATWFCRPADAPDLDRRFGSLIEAGKLKPDDADERPDLRAWAWARGAGLDGLVSPELMADLRRPIEHPAVRCAFTADRLVRARVLDDFGRSTEARRGYRGAALLGPRRRRATSALISSGLIHGAPWRGPAIALLNRACDLPLNWRWPHLQRLPYLTFNVEAEPRLRALERSLQVVGHRPRIVMAAANAAKEVDPRRSIELAREAQREALDADEPAQLAWATFTLSLALRWYGDLAEARVQAALLADSYGALAGPAWAAWGFFERAAVAALSGDLTAATEDAGRAVEIFAAAGSLFLFDAWCATIAIARAAGDSATRTLAYEEAVALLTQTRLRKRFMREVLLVEEGELAREDGRYDEAAMSYRQLEHSPTLAQRVLGLLGLGEVERARGEEPAAAWAALRLGDERGCGYAQVHACVTLGLAGAMDAEEAERRIAASVFDPPVRDDAEGLLRFCQGPDPARHILCFP